MSTAAVVDPVPSAGGTVASRPSDYLVVAVWSALFFGLVEAAVLVFRRYVLNEFIFSSRDVLWMAPAAYLVAYGLPAVGLAVLARRRILVFPLMWAAAIIFTVAVAMLVRLLSYHRIHMLSVIVLAAGVGVQAARWLVRRPQRLQRLRRSVPGLFALVVVLAAGSRARRAFAERRAVERLPAAAAGAPNVLLLILDTVGADHLGLYGYTRPTTPYLERRVGAGVMFERAIAPSSFTLQSHATFFTGRSSRELGVNFVTPLDGTYSTLAGVLANRGYATAGFVANQAFASYESGLSRGFDHYEGYRPSLKQIALSSELGQYLNDWNSQVVLRMNAAKRAPEVTAGFLDWSQRLPSGRPFFAFLNYMDAHVPYTAPDSLRARFGADTSERALDQYDAAVAFLDQEVSRLLDTLAARGVLEHTVVIVSSDHGELFGEHGLWDHASNLYYRGLHVPLLMFGPGVPAGRRVPTPVGLRELPATIDELTGTRSNVFPGRSLARFWNGNPTPEPYVLVELARRPRAPSRFPNARGPMVGVFSGRHHYIRSGTGVEELYDYWSDPQEREDLVDTPESARRLVELRALARGTPARH